MQQQRSAANKGPARQTLSFAFLAPRQQRAPEQGRAEPGARGCWGQRGPRCAPRPGREPDLPPAASATGGLCTSKLSPRGGRGKEELSFPLHEGKTVTRTEEEGRLQDAPCKQGWWASLVFSRAGGNLRLPAHSANQCIQPSSCQPKKKRILKLFLVACEVLKSHRGRFSQHEADVPCHGKQHLAQRARGASPQAAPLPHKFHLALPGRLPAWLTLVW